MQYKGAVFFDYDGTLADEKKGIFYPTETTKKALSELSENGYLVILATGRAKCYVPDVGIDFDGYVTSNGACAEVGNEIIQQCFFEESDLKELMNKFDESGLFYSMENHDACFAKDPENPEFVAMLDNFNIPRDVFYKLDKNNLPKASKMLLAYGDDQNFDYFADYFKGKFNFGKHRKFPSADISRAEYIKSLGAKAICEHFNIAPENTYAFGDETNDYDLLEFVGHGIAMGEHSPMLDNVAEMITDTVVNEGIYRALVKYGLVK